MTGSCATINVALRYIICSNLQEDCDADCQNDTAPGTRLDLGPADHGAAGFAGRAMVPEDHLGASGGAADFTCLAHRLRRRLAHCTSGAAERPARGRSCRT